MSSNSNRQFLFIQLLWLGITLAISLAISILLPFPVSLVTIIGVIILLNFYMGRRMIRRMGMGRRGAGILGSFSSMSENSSVKYYCMSCGVQHRQAACPRCGSKMKRVGSWSTFLGAGSQKVRCTVSDAFSADLLFFQALILKHQYVENASRKLNRWILRLTMKKNARNVATEE